MTDRPTDSAESGAQPVAGSGPAPGGERRRPTARPTERLRRSEKPAVAPDDPKLVPGARISGRRYRLLVSHGGTPPLQFWQALDTALDRQVALVFVDREGKLPRSVLDDILSRTLRLSRIDKPGIARVLDVVHSGSGGLVVAEWIRGGSLKEVADTSPSPIGSARATQSLVQAAEAAHRAGGALSIDHPDRVRVSIDGNVVLAYPATLPDADPQEDIRGTGAALYALLVKRWPLPGTGTPGGFARAERDAAGNPVEPMTINPDIPFQISAVAARAVQDGGGIRSAATLSNLLQQATTVADRTEMIGPLDDSPALPATDAEVGARRRRNVLIGVGVGLAALVAVLLVLAAVVSRIFGHLGGDLSRTQLGLNLPTTTTSAATGDLIKPTKATVFSPDGEADNPGQAGQAIEGDTSASWSTDVYSDAVPFPGFKQGVGLMLQLPNPVVVGQVTIDTPSSGTKVEIRSATSPSPATLNDTTVLTPAFALKPGHNVIPVRAGNSTSNLLVWISTLGTTNGKSQASLSAITVQAAS